MQSRDINTGLITATWKPHAHGIAFTKYRRQTADHHRPDEQEKAGGRSEPIVKRVQADVNNCQR
jgi:aryl-alcohol dehydrogenase-like predicted oxidoreductase